jgi:pyrroline-5-carboxylate reductase
MNSNNLGKLAVIGTGAMGASLTKGVIAAGLFKPGDVTMSDIDSAKLKVCADTLGVNITKDNSEAVKGADIILLALKPNIMPIALSQISNSLQSGQLLISIAAGVKLQTMESHLPEGSAVIRAMPNTPSMVMAGATAFCRGNSCTDKHAEMGKNFFDAVGVSMEVQEKMLDAVTGLSGSGPAYVYIMIEALSDAGVRVGLTRDVALRLAAQTVMGSALMVIQSGEHPGALKDKVTSPGGTTIAGIDALEKSGFRSALIEAVKAATKRSEELG